MNNVTKYEVWHIDNVDAANNYLIKVLDSELEARMFTEGALYGYSSAYIETWTVEYKSVVYRV